MLLLGRQETWGTLCSSVVSAKNIPQVKGDDKAKLEPNIHTEEKEMLGDILFRSIPMIQLPCMFSLGL